MPTARATEAVHLWIGTVECHFAADELVDGDVAALVLANPTLPFEAVADDPTPKHTRSKKTAGPSKAADSAPDSEDTP